MSRLRRFSIALLVGVAGAIGTTANASAQVDAGVIEISVDSPPSIAAALDVRLLRGGMDITDSACGELITTDDRPIPGRRCAPLDDGDYSVEVAGAPAGTVTLWECVDIVAARTEPSSIPIGGGFTEWACAATVAPPGVLVDPIESIGDDGPIPSLDIEIVDAAGAVVPDECETDNRYDSAAGDRRWCVPLPDGTYTIRAVDVPEGARATTFCFPLSGLGVDGVGAVTIDATTPIWSCDNAFAVPPLAFTVFWDGARGRDRGWFEELSFVITDADGNEANATCDETQRFDDGVAAFVDVDCLGLDDGEYTVTLDRVPDGFTVESECAPVEIVAEGSSCSISVISEPLVVETTVPPPPTTVPPPDMTDLPETGTPSSNTAAMAAIVLAAGLGLLLLSRRRASC